MIELMMSNLTILAAVVIFLILTLLLVAILLFAKAKLTPSGELKIRINGEREVITSAGQVSNQNQPAVAVRLVGNGFPF